MVLIQGEKLARECPITPIYVRSSKSTTEVTDLTIYNLGSALLYPTSSKGKSTSCREGQVIIYMLIASHPQLEAMELCSLFYHEGDCV